LPFESVGDVIWKIECDLHDLPSFVDRTLLEELPNRPTAPFLMPSR
jgi:hypothetical protein